MWNDPSDKRISQTVQPKTSFDLIRLRFCLVSLSLSLFNSASLAWRLRRNTQRYLSHTYTKYTLDTNKLININFYSNKYCLAHICQTKGCNSNSSHQERQNRSFRVFSVSLCPLWSVQCGLCPLWQSRSRHALVHTHQLTARRSADCWVLLLYEFSPHLHINLIPNSDLFARLHTHYQRQRESAVKSHTAMHTQRCHAHTALPCTQEIIIIENATVFETERFILCADQTIVRKRRWLGDRSIQKRPPNSNRMKPWATLNDDFICIFQRSWQ